ncbi:MAG: S-layer homology domain-containing protein, partial [Oscillospiraceae bacterium]|nr:S-layer homology domain-containing protein [Oscillospiraceae bacterium]
YGYPDYTVKPEQGITRAEAASIFYRLLQVEYMENNAVSAFNDVNDEDWFAQAINTLAELNIILGYEDGTFRPNDPITRAEFATIATRFDELSPADGIAFSDVSEDHWAVDFISSAYAVGWVGGYEDGTFRPEQNISRAEVVKIVNTMLNRLPEHLPEELENPYTDIEVSHWAYIHIIEASIEHKYDRDGNGIERWLSYIPGGYLARRDDDNGAGGAGDGDDVDDDGEAGE